MIDLFRGGTVDQAIRQVTAYLSHGSMTQEEASLDARHLVAASIDTSPDRLLLHGRDKVSEEVAERLYRVLMERCKGRPIAQIVGHRLFWGRPLHVTDDVLVPRPETETLIELALTEPFWEVLDLGTGSGCIAVTLLAERSEATGIASDISELALAVAKKNAEDTGVIDRLHIECSEWFEAIGGTYDLIVSNPPYVSAAEYETLSPEVHHEPRIALTPGGDGLDAYRAIAAGAPAHLKPGGRLLVEIGYEQADAVSQLFLAAGLEDIAVHPDINGKDRVISARKAAP